MRHTFVDKARPFERPVPEEIIPIPTERIPKSPPTTPITAVRDDFSKPVVIDINIPGEGGCILQTENELPKPEVHQRLTLSNEYDQATFEMEHEMIVPKPRARKRVSVVQTPEEETTKSLLEQPHTPIESEVVSSFSRDEVLMFTDDKVNGRETIDSSEIVASSETLNEFEAFIEQERKEMELIKQSQTLKAVEIREDELVIVQQDSNMDITEKTTTTKSVQIISVQLKEQPETDSINKKNDNPLKEEFSKEPERLPEKIKLPYLDLEESLDASKIVSPKPRMRKGILKKKAPPVPISIPTSENDSKIEETENNEEQLGILRWSDPDQTYPEEVITESIEINAKKEVKFNSSEPDIIPDNKANEKRSVVDIIQEIEEVTREYETYEKEPEEAIVREEENEKDSKKNFVQITEVKKLEESKEAKQTPVTEIIKIEGFDEKVLMKVPEGITEDIEIFEEVLVKSPDSVSTFPTLPKDRQ